MAERNAQMSCRLMELDSRCLMLVFGHLSDVDLANLKESYDELAEVANTEFETRGSSILFCEDNTDESLQVFRHFGRFFDRIELRYDEICDERLWGDIFSVINEYCSENLRSFALIGEAINRIKRCEIVEFSQKLQNVEEIHLSNKYSAILSDYNYIVAHCVNVRKAIINTMLDLSHLLEFIKNNPNLLSLEFIEPFDEPLALVLATIVDCLMETRLEEFGIQVFDERRIMYNDLLRLKHLKHLGICVKDYLQSERVNSLVCLQPHRLNSLLESIDGENILLTTLTLSNIFLSETYTQKLSEITRLKVLKLIDCFFSDNSFFGKLLTLCGNKNFENITILFGNGRCDQCKPLNDLAPCNDCDGMIDRNFIDKDGFLEILLARLKSEDAKRLYLVFNRGIYLKTLQTISPATRKEYESIVKLMDPYEKNCEYDNNFHFTCN